jgi:galactokinase
VSSSSAINIATSLAAMTAFKLSISKEDIAHQAMISERYVGVEGGG